MKIFKDKVIIMLICFTILGSAAIWAGFYYMNHVESVASIGNEELIELIEQNANIEEVLQEEIIKVSDVSKE